MDITAEEKLVLFLSQPNLSPELVNQYLDGLKGAKIDYDEVLRNAAFGGVTPVMYLNTKHFVALPEEFKRRLKTAYISTSLKNEAHLRETMRILELMKAESIPVIPLKGSLGAAVLIGDPGCYPTGDIDILVPFESQQKAGNALLNAGFRDDSAENELPGNYHRSYFQDSFILELHWNLVKKYFSVSPDFWWRDTRITDCNAGPTLQLSPEKYLLYLMFRLFSHSFAPLRFFILILALMRKERFDWQKVWIAADELKMKRLTLFTLKIFSDLFDINVPDRVNDKKMIGYRFMRRLVVDGLFRGDRRAYLRMIVYMSLLDRPDDMAKVLVKKAYPSTAEVRLRYNIPRRSLKILPYYFLNPLLMLFKKSSR